VWEYCITLMLCVQMVDIEAENGEFIRIETRSPIMDPEDAFGRALMNAVRYDLAGHTLELPDAAGGVTLAFIAWKSEPQPTPEPKIWPLVAIVAQGAVTLPLEGVEITLRLVDGCNAQRSMMAGTAGCNNYQAHYSRTGADLTLTRITATGLSCPEPESVMEQEVRFLSLLADVTVIRFNNDRLHLHAVDGAELRFAK
jgi:heat shock protein HslJ